MTQEQFLEVMKDTFNNCKKLTEVKGADYTNGATDVLTYFKDAAEEAGDDPKKICYIMMRKHWMVIQSYVRTNGKSQSEPISGRFQDLHNYLLFMEALIIEELSKPTEDAGTN